MTDVQRGIIAVLAVLVVFAVLLGVYALMAALTMKQQLYSLALRMRDAEQFISDLNMRTIYWYADAGGIVREDPNAQQETTDENRPAKGEDPQGNPSGWTHPLARH